MASGSPKQAASRSDGPVDASMRQVPNGAGVLKVLQHPPTTAVCSGGVVLADLLRSQNRESQIIGVGCSGSSSTTMVGNQ